jgi:glycosyltransferase involved in cell wall biosynthesis
MFRHFFSSKKSDAARRLAEELEILHNSPLVDPVWYRQTYPDLRDAPIDVARHYLEHGAAEGRNPHPLFDTKFYLAQNPDVVESGVNPLLHYIQHGASEGRSPSPRFCTQFYLSQNPEIAAEGINPLVHYLEKGVAESESPAHDDATQRVRKSGYFDAKWYLDNNPDVATEGIDPLQHFMDHGALEGRSPSLRFHTPSYLSAYPYVATMGINPLLHYLEHGRPEEPDTWPSRELAASLNGGYYGARVIDFDERFTPENPSHALRNEARLRYIFATHTISSQYQVEQKTPEIDALRAGAPSAAIRVAFASAEPSNVIARTISVTSLNEPIYSILTPFHRHLNFFANCAASVAALVATDFEAHSRRRIEWIVFNDDPSCGPEDLEARVPESLRPYISIVSGNYNRGISKGLNEAARVARGHWLILLDCDDEIESDASIVLDHYRTAFPEVRYISSAMTDIDATGSILRRRYHEFDPTRLFEAGMIVGHLKAIRRDLLEDFGGYREEFSGCQDYDFAMRVALNEPLLVIPEYLYRYRWHNHSQSVGARAVQSACTLAVLRTFLLEFGGRYQAASIHSEQNFTSLRAGYCIIRTQGTRLELLSEAIESVLRQSIPITPLVVVHGDRKTQICVRDILTEKNLTVEVIGAPDTNRRIGYPTNVALDHLRSVAGPDEFFCFLDDDDILYPFFADRLVCLLELTGADIAVAVANKRVPWNAPEKGHQLLPVSALVAGNFIPIHCYAARVNLLHQTGARCREDMGYLDDWDFLVTLLESGARFRLIGDVLCEYRIIGDGNVSVRRDPEHFRNCTARVLAHSRLAAPRIGFGRLCCDLGEFDFSMRSAITTEDVAHLVSARDLFAIEMKKTGYDPG